MKVLLVALNPGVKSIIVGDTLKFISEENNFLQKGYISNISLYDSPYTKFESLSFDGKKTNELLVEVYKIKINNNNFILLTGYDSLDVNFPISRTRIVLTEKNIFPIYWKYATMTNNEILYRDDRSI